MTDNLFKSLVGNLFSKSDSAIGIDIGSSAIKVVQIKKQGSVAVLETYGELALGPYANAGIGRAVQLPPEKVSEALQNVLQEANVTTKNGAVAIPLSSSLVTLIDLPNLKESQLAEMIPLEARKYIPVPITEVTLDWWIAPPSISAVVTQEPAIEGESESKETQKRTQAQEERAGNRVEVLVVAIHNEALSTYRQVVKEAGLSTNFFEIEVFSTIRAVLEQGGVPQLVLDFGASATKLYIVDRGMVRVSHLVNKGSQDITISIAKSFGVEHDRAEEIKRSFGLNQEIEGKKLDEVIPTSLDHIFSETNRVLTNFQKKYNKVVERAVLCGGGSMLPGFIERARERLSLQVEFADPFDKLETPAFLVEMLKETGPEFAVAIGLALRCLQE